MSDTDRNADEEQRRPSDVRQLPEQQEKIDRSSIAPAAVQPAGRKDEKERPVVDPVTGAPL